MRNYGTSIICKRGSYELYLIFHVFFQLTMVLSSFYHTFSCHSPKVSENCLSLDLLGITMGLLATYLSGIYYAFWCTPFWRDFYLSTVGGLFIIATLAQFIPGFGDEKNEKKRLGLFTFWAIYGIIPTIHWVTLHPENIGDPLVTAMLPRIIFMYFICGVAFFFYVTKLPERFLPGKSKFLACLARWPVFTFMSTLTKHSHPLIGLYSWLITVPNGARSTW